MDNSAGTIDITDIVEKMKSAWVASAKDYLMASILALPGIGFLAAPFMEAIMGGALTWGLTALSEWALMKSFFEGTAIRKASQSKDFIDAVIELENLPLDVSDEAYKAAEQKRIVSFRNFVMVTN